MQSNMKSTKELAKELGLLKKKPRINKDSKTDGMAQLFSYLIVLDFESTCWQNDKFRSQEIIEFPAVLLNLKTGEIESEFQSYVQPQENPILSDFCIQLTGISQNQVDEGIPLFICLKKFSAWLTQQSKLKKFSFLPNITSSNACFLTWSDWDLSVCLHYECRRKQLRKPPEMDCWIDLRATYRKFYNRRPNGLKGALQEVGINFEGREHSGLHDSRNTAMLVKKMILDGCRLQNINVGSLNNELWRFRASLNSSLNNPQQYVETKELEHKLCPSNDEAHSLKQVEKSNNVIEEKWFDDDIDDTDILLCTYTGITSGAIEQTSEAKDGNDISIGGTGRNLVKAVQASAAESLSPTILSQTKPYSSPHLNKSGTSSVSLGGKHFECELQKRMNFPSSILNNTSNKENIIARDTSKNHLVNSLSRSPLVPVSLNISHFANNHHLDKTMSSASTPAKALPKLQLTSKTLITHTPVQPVFHGSPATTTYKTPPPSLLSTSLNSTSFSTPTSSRTPPLCGCGCRTKRKHVRNGGPNHGRTFFSCSKRSGCKFFEWEFKQVPQPDISMTRLSSSVLSSPCEISSSYMDK